MHAKYNALLPKAKFQKGCVNFKNAEEIPPGIAEDPIRECAAEDYASIVTKHRKK